MTSILISIAVFVGVAALAGGLIVLFRDRKDTQVEDRLEMLAGLKSAGSAAKDESVIKGGALAALEEGSGLIEQLLNRFGNFKKFFEQADTSLSPSKFFAISVGLGFGGGLVAWAMGANPGIVPVAMVMTGLGPLAYLMIRRKRRLKKFAAQLPDALELISRALRAGHSLAAGLNLVADEMPAPVGIEFGRTFEEQNLGVPLDDSLKSMTQRVPNLDLKFFATAVILQRQTGGDLAEILDKIGHLIRERFRIWGQVQALTGEGRLSGVILLALPPFLFLAVYYLNPEYCMILFEDPMGKQMLAVAIVLQVIGALVIKKIINIKV